MTRFFCYGLFSCNNRVTIFLQANMGSQPPSQSNYTNPPQSILNPPKQFMDSTSVYLQTGSQPDSVYSFPINVTGARTTQHMFVPPAPPPAAPPPVVPVPPTNQRPPVFINTTIPTRCTWVPTQPMLLRPMHAVNQPRTVPPQMMSHSMAQAPTQASSYHSHSIRLCS